MSNSLVVTDRQSVLGLKRALKDYLPQYKSSHITEALASGFDYQCNADLLKETSDQPVSFSSDRFNKRAQSFGYEPLSEEVWKKIWDSLETGSTVAQWPSKLNGIHIIASKRAGPCALAVESAFKQEILDSVLLPFLVLRVSMKRMDVFEVFYSPSINFRSTELSEWIQKNGARYDYSLSAWTATVLSDTRNIVRSVETSMLLQPKLALFENVTGTTLAKLAVFVAGKGCKTIVGVPANSADGALGLLGKCGIPKEKLCNPDLFSRIDSVHFYPSSEFGWSYSDKTSKVQLAEQRNTTVEYLKAAVDRLSEKTREKIRFPETCVPDRLGANKSVRESMIDMVNWIIELHKVKTKQAARGTSEWKIQSLTNLCQSLIDKNSSAEFQVLELLRNSRRIIAYAALNKEKLDSSDLPDFLSITNIIHRNMLVGLLSECSRKDVVYRHDGIDYTSYQIVMDAWTGGELSARYAQSLTNELLYQLINKDLLFGVDIRAYIDC